jgi:hypothetical protein
MEITIVRVQIMPFLVSQLLIILNGWIFCLKRVPLPIPFPIVLPKVATSRFFSTFPQLIFTLSNILEFCDGLEMFHSLLLCFLKWRRWLIQISWKLLPKDSCVTSLERNVYLQLLTHERDTISEIQKWKSPELFIHLFTVFCKDYFRLADVIVLDFKLRLNF